MTDMKRLSVSLPDDIDNALLELRKSDEYVRCSYAELIRIVLKRGLGIEEKDAPPS